MAVNNAQFIPGNPVFQAIRPLNKGIQLHEPPQMAPPGSLQDAQNFQVIPNGLQRREAHQRYAGSLAVDYPPIQDMYVFFDTSTGLQKTVVVDQKFIYEFNNTAMTGKYWTYTTGTITSTATDKTITGSSTLWNTAASKVQAGDIIVLDANGSGDGPETLEIDTITNDTSLETTVATIYTHPGGTDYEIRRAFKTVEGRFVDAVVNADNDLIFVDGTRAPYKYDGTTFTEVASALTIVPACIGYFRDRLFYGKILSGGTDYRYRIMWTEPGVFNTIPATNYVDLPYQPGEVVELVPMGNTLVAFFDDAVYLGIPSQIPTLPVYFQRIDTGNVGLVGMKAFTDFFDSLFFVGQDNIYQLSTQGIQAIGTPIVKASLDECDTKENIYTVVDTERSRVVFGFPQSGTEIEELWTYDYRTKAWGTEKITCNSLSNISIFTGYTIDGLDAISATIDGLDTYFNSIDSMTYSNVAPYNIYLGVSDVVEYFLKQTTDEAGARIVSIIETQDYDLGKPEKNKTFSELSLKLESAITTDLSFTLEGSKDRGTTWYSEGTLTILANETEGKVNFKLTGGIGRFKLTSTTDNEQYVVNEILLKVKLRGAEARFDG